MAFLGEIRAFTGRLPSDDWLPCDGRSLPIDANPGLFSLLGHRYGGEEADGFQLPDLRGRVTAGADPAAGKSVGGTSGVADDDGPLLPFEVVHWAICVRGDFPHGD
jgi:microcystin-dependent protein